MAEAFRTQIASFENQTNIRAIQLRRRYNDWVKNRIASAYVLSGGSSIYLTPEDVHDEPVERGHQHWFPNLKIGTGVDENGFMITSRKHPEWLRRALYLFKFNKELPDVQVHSGAYKRVITDKAFDSAYSIEFYWGDKYERSLNHRNILKKRLLDLDVVYPLEITGTGNSRAGFIFQRLQYCSPVELFHGATEAYKDKDVLKILRDIIFGIVPTVKTMHSRRVYHQDIKTENIFLCPSGTGERYTLGDLDGALIFDGESRTQPLIATTPISVIHMKGRVTEAEARENDIAALCIVVLTMCSRTYFVQKQYFSDDSSKKNKAIELWNKVIGRAGMSPHPALHSKSFWRDAFAIASSWKSGSYHEAFSSANLHSFKNTVEACLQILDSIQEKKQQLHLGFDAHLSKALGRDAEEAGLASMENQPLAMSCKICSKEMLKADILHLKCGHSFHSGCICAWSDADKENGRMAKCPVCEQSFEATAICQKIATA